MTFGDKLKKIRKFKKLNQKEVADKLNIAISTYSQYESDIRKPNYKIIIDIKNLYHVSYDYLLNENNDLFINDDIILYDLVLDSFMNVLKKINRLIYLIDNYKKTEDEELDIITINHYKNKLKNLSYELDSTRTSAYNILDLNELDSILEKYMYKQK